MTGYYIDTSVFGEYFDAEFDEITQQLFDYILAKRIKILCSELTENELDSAPEGINTFIRELPSDSIEYIEISKESIELADKYIEDNVVS